MYEFKHTTEQWTGETVQYSRDTPPEETTMTLKHDMCVEVVEHEGYLVPHIWDRQANIDQTWLSKLEEKFEEWFIGDFETDDPAWCETDTGLCVYQKGGNKGKHLAWSIIQAWIIDELNDYTHEG